IDARDHGEPQPHGNRLHDQGAGHDAAQPLHRVLLRLVAGAQRPVLAAVGQVAPFAVRAQFLRGHVGLTTARVVRTRRSGGSVVGHWGSFPNRVRASPAVTTEPVTTTPEPLTMPSPESVSSASAMASSTADGSVSMR